MKKIGAIIKWTLVGFLSLVVMVQISEGALLSALCAAGAAVLFFPSLTNRVQTRLPWLRFTWVKVGIGVILFFMMAAFSPSETSTSQATLLPSPSPSVSPSSSISPTPVGLAEATVPSPVTQQAIVTKVIDGDTIDVSFEGKTQRVRVIGINTPETVDPRKSVECFGEKASTMSKEYLNGQTVWLEADPSQGNQDKYQRLLRYVWTDDASVDYGKVMIATGFAYEYTYDTPYKYLTEYKQAQQMAETNKNGLWADDACLATTSPTAKPKATSNPTTLQKSTSPKPQNGPSCSGPDLDCGDFSTHAQAQAFFDSCGFTATNDPMKLDSTGVGDGVACESLP